MITNEEDRCALEIICHVTAGPPVFATGQALSRLFGGRPVQIDTLRESADPGVILRVHTPENQARQRWPQVRKRLQDGQLLDYCEVRLRGPPATYMSQLWPPSDEDP